MMYDIQKASMGKRISAFLFDIIIFSIIAVGVATVFSAIFGYGKIYDEFDGFLNEYQEKYEEEYGIDFDISESDYEALSEEDKAKYDEANEAIFKEEDLQRTYSLLVNLSIVMVSLSVLVAILVVELAIPLIFKNGQTLGKKIFGIALVRSDSVKVTPLFLFIRSVLGKFTIETMAPIMIIFMIFFADAGIFGTISIVLLLVCNLIAMIATQNHSLIHDLLANTVVVDMATQMIFDTPEEMMEYKKRVHAEAAERAKTTY